MSKGAELNVRATDGGDNYIPLIYALSGDGTSLNYLLDKGADIDFQTVKGVTALMVAAFRGDEKKTRLLLNRKASVNIKCREGQTALMWAAFRNSDCSPQLLDHMADLNVRDNEGKTALMWAAICGHEEVVQLLRERGANVSDKDLFGNTVLKLALERQNFKAAEALQRAGAKE